MALNAPDLPSRGGETFAACPQFRILVAGNTGVGKSSLVSSVFNIGLEHTMMPGRQISERNTLSKENPRFILHDSQGFEPGSTENWETAEEFILDRSRRELPQERLHAIWLCIETPQTGSRVMQTGDEKMLSLATELQVPVIAVFTKYDILFKGQFKIARKNKVPANEVVTVAERNAEAFFKSCIKGFQHSECIKVSTHTQYKQRLETLRVLTVVTRKQLHDVEGDLWVPWAAAQQISARQKVEFSISEGFKKYWLNLGASTAFQGQVLLNCILRIHLDILEVWSFYDPEKLLSGEEFRAKMIKLVEPMLSESDTQPRQNDIATYSNLVTIAGAVGSTFAHVLGGVGITVVASKFLFDKYQSITLTARYLSAYIVDVTLILHDLLMDLLPSEPPRPISRQLIDDTIQKYKVSNSVQVHGLVREITSGKRVPHPEERIADLIRELLHMEKA